jgi:hypothetical protein
MSRHRSDHSVDHNDDTKEVSSPVRLRRIEVITGAERRRKWSADEKAEIIAESLAEGAVVSDGRAVTASVRSSCSVGVRGCATQ